MPAAELSSMASVIDETKIEATGIKHDAEKPLVSLVPPKALLAEAAVWTFGVRKYSAYNWANGLKFSRIISALLRHTLAIMNGEDTDPETGQLHAAHIRCCAAMLIEFTMAGRADLDDRMNGPFVGSGAANKVTNES